ncbi:MAG: membrane protein insertion efficiency factor YidD [Actinobacteria bacterium]|nr:membrane protein insertion efficiency factor YidD [Actinomycetota bacterium]
MIRRLLVRRIERYQRRPGRVRGVCRMRPSCSEYARQAIETYGAFHGSILAARRIDNCRPHGPVGFQPLPTTLSARQRRVHWLVLSFVAILIIALVVAVIV